MSDRKTFSSVETLEELNRVNDAQKAAWEALNKESGGALFAQRQQAYLKRWEEAAVYIPQGASLLDIGGG